MNPFSNGLRAYAWNYNGVKLITLENEVIRTSIVPHYGCTMIELRYKPKDVNLLYLPQNAIEKIIFSRKKDFYQYFIGGWFEVIPNVGESNFEYKGTTWTTNEETPFLSWKYEVLEGNENIASVKFYTILTKYPLKVEKIMLLERGKGELVINETIENMCEIPFVYMWSHQIFLGKPFIGESVKIEIPAKTIIVHGPPPYSEDILLKPGYSGDWPICETINGDKVDISVISDDKNICELAYVTDLEDGYVKIINKKLGFYFKLTFPKEIFKYIWILRNFNGSRHYPWYRSAYTLGIMPSTSYPACGLLRAIENNTARRIKGYEKVKVTLKASIGSV